mmetsp:Transcript_65573/g.58847  ORF Transcript_65573/g.58847 Transcript_65573/m.58847 type:complete len:468 (-) Transcript_65573:197-1600(-)
MACKFGLAVLIYCIIAIIVHCLFIAYIFLNRPIDCANGDHGLGNDVPFEFEVFLIWAIVYFPFLLLCAFYTLLFRMSRSFLCSCWECCGNDVHAKGATKCKICFEGVCGNPLIFAIVFIIGGVWTWLQFDSCAFEVQYGFLGDLVVVSISLLLLCIYYFVRVKSRFEKKRNANIAKKYHDQQREDGGGFDEGGGDVDVEMAGHIQNNHPVPDRSPNQGYQIQAPPKRMSRLAMQREGSGQPKPHQPNRRFSAQPQGVMAKGAGLSPAYAASAHGVAPYAPDPRRHSYQPNARGNIARNQSPFQSPQNIHVAPPAYAASAHGVAPFRPQQGNGRRHSYQPNGYNDNPLIENSPGISSHQKQESASIEISVDLGGDDEPEVISSGPRTRGASISFPSKFKGHARRVSSGILNILMKIDAEPECAVCMDDLAKGDEMGQLECGHTFHKDCIVEWLDTEPSCPMCRVSMEK